MILRYAVRVNGLTQLAINKLDTLAGVGDLKVCTAYELPDGTRLTEYPESLEVLADCKPVYETIPGFTEDISGCRSFDELPESCKRYIAELEKLCDCRISMVGVGPRAGAEPAARLSVVAPAAVCALPSFAGGPANTARKPLFPRRFSAFVQNFRKSLPSPLGGGRLLFFSPRAV